jgi:hypothetical protein
MAAGRARHRQKGPALDAIGRLFKRCLRGGILAAMEFGDAFFERILLRARGQSRQQQGGANDPHRRSPGPIR